MPSSTCPRRPPARAGIRAPRSLRSSVAPGRCSRRGRAACSCARSHSAPRRCVTRPSCLKGRCRAAGVPFCVNDRLDVALAVGADVVHLGQDDLPLADARRIAAGRLLIGFSTHNPAQAAAAVAGGADYIGFGPIFDTRSKLRPDPDRRRRRRCAPSPPRRRSRSSPSAASRSATVAAVAAAGAAAAAVIAAVNDAPDPTRRRPPGRRRLRVAALSTLAVAGLAAAGTPLGSFASA